MSLPLTFRDHILRSVPHEQRREVHIDANGYGDLESVLVLSLRGNTLLCECRDGYAYVTLIQSSGARTDAIECNTTDHVTRMWGRL